MLLRCKAALLNTALAKVVSKWQARCGRMTCVCCSTTAKLTKQAHGSNGDSAPCSFLFKFVCLLDLYLTCCNTQRIGVKEIFLLENFFFFQFQLFPPFLKSLRTFSAVDVHSEVPEQATYPLAIKDVMQANSSVLPGCGSCTLLPARLGTVSLS